jgi:hypothetical protein
MSMSSVTEASTSAPVWGSIKVALSKEPKERGAKKETERPRLKLGPLRHWNG